MTQVNFILYTSYCTYFHLHGHQCQITFTFLKLFLFQLHSEYRSTYRWHEYTPRQQQVVSRPPQPLHGAGPDGGGADADEDADADADADEDADGYCDGDGVIGVGDGVIGDADGVIGDDDVLLVTRVLMVCTTPAVMSAGGIDGSDFSRRKKHPDLAYRAHQVNTFDKM